MKLALAVSIIGNCVAILGMIKLYYKYTKLRKLVDTGDIIANLAKQAEGMAELFSPASTAAQKTEGLAKAKAVKSPEELDLAAVSEQNPEK